MGARLIVETVNGWLRERVDVEGAQVQVPRTGAPWNGADGGVVRRERPAGAVARSAAIAPPFGLQPG